MTMKLKIPPALVFLSFAILMYLLDFWLPVGEFEFFGRKWMIYALTGIAILVSLVALLQFSRAGTTIDPRDPAKSKVLVTTGIYNYTRNPMYLALLLLLLAWGLYLGNAFNTLLAALFVAYMNRFQILPEEESLEKEFGQVYRTYCMAVRRWF
ncbi:methyltransferase family protein [Zeaxanthinibacter enoshimensis]|uniref:Protein-S-isoprenylcysteine O-methyltransferase Ste14 n=1 Tax=Zeaxanthinibacter enoshimensis TaxID=392009 RepID=A0A4R6TGH7_9FLAO|nr:isoprenylcysteine carboxylmethyltransferase family protein [Zeaxanthinibacter enoshimensis]TDQ29475.1 protein-S-isoprenylcysteine O-methyltransferase Ste14 [Zeaxanthinibacter enoshimensis]